MVAGDTQIFSIVATEEQVYPVRNRRFLPLFPVESCLQVQLSYGHEVAAESRGLRFYLVIIALVAGTLLAGTTGPRSILAGLPCLILGVWLHTWAKGCLRQNRVVATIGPYRFVRHPFYLANALIDAGLVSNGRLVAAGLVLPLHFNPIYRGGVCKSNY